MKTEIKNSLGEINCEVLIEEKSKSPMFIWKGFTFMPELEKACEAMLKMVEATGANAYISDNRLATGYDDEMPVWTAKNFVPKLKALGIKKHAIIFPDDVFAAISTDEFKSNLAPFFEADVFTDMDRAIEWVKS